MFARVLTTPINSNWWRPDYIRALYDIPCYIHSYMRPPSSERLLVAYYNTFPSIAGFHTSDPQFAYMCDKLHPMWVQHLSTHVALSHCTYHHNRALNLLYDNTHNYRPDTRIGELLDIAAPIVGKAAKLLIMQPYVSDALTLTHIYRNVRQKRLDTTEKQQLFRVGNFIRTLYKESHDAFISHLGRIDEY